MPKKLEHTVVDASQSSGDSAVGGMHVAYSLATQVQGLLEGSHTAFILRS